MDTTTKRKVGRPGRGRTSHLHQRCTPEWLAWLNDFASAEDVPVVELISRAVDLYAGVRRHDAPPAR